MKCEKFCGMTGCRLFGCAERMEEEERLRELAATLGVPWEQAARFLSAPSREGA